MHHAANENRKWYTRTQKHNDTLLFLYLIATSPSDCINIKLTATALFMSIMFLMDRRAQSEERVHCARNKCVQQFTIMMLGGRWNGWRCYVKTSSGSTRAIMQAAEVMLQR